MPDEQEMYTMNDDNWRKATAGNYEAAGIAQASYGNYGQRTFDNVTPSMSIKSQYAGSDYDFYRLNEALPTNPIDIVRVCNRAYKGCGIVRNIIDLMSEFTCKGIRVVHSNKTAEQFGIEWFNYVNGVSVSERFTNNLYRSANVPIITTYGKVPAKVTKKWSKTQSDIQVNEPKVTKLRMPLKYTFINPESIEPIVPELSIFTGKQIYALKIGQSLTSAINKISRVNNGNIADIINQIPDSVKQALTSNAKYIPLDEENFSMFFYKKDDWEVWATPMIYSILPDIITLKKMQLADKSALDGAISNIRLWNIGHLTDNPQTCIIPTKAMINKLRGILSNGVGGGTMDLVWGPDLQFKESNTQVHHFLGIEKYEPIYKSIYEGMGVPSTTGGGGEGFNTSFLQMQTLIERLEYGRTVLLKFWEQELKKVQLAMGYTKPFRIMFDQIALGDDSAIKKLLMDMVDRDILSVDTFLDKMNLFSNIEMAKIKREYKSRRQENMPNKASPFHNPQTEEDMKKTIINQGGVAPSELGIQLHPKKPGEETYMEKQAKLAKEQQQYNPVGVNGRPPNKKDTVKRKQRAVKPSKASQDSFVSRFIWANAAQKKISDIITPEMVDAFGKSDVRSLTSEEVDRVEFAKFSVLSNMEPYSDISIESIYNALSSQAKVNNDMEYALKAFVYKFAELNERQPSLEEKRQMQASAFSLYYEPEDDVSYDDDDFIE